VESILSPEFLHHNQRKLNDPPVLGVRFAVRIFHVTGIYPELSRRGGIDQRQDGTEHGA
jgi:hypothetical protein